jgi:hypothetical protein
MKKIYLKPKVQIVKMLQTQMLCASLPDYDDYEEQLVDVYDDPEDLIDDPGEVW